MILEFFVNGDGSQYGFCLKALNGVEMMTSKGYSTYLKAVMGWRTVQRLLFIDDFDIRYRWSKEMQ